MLATETTLLLISYLFFLPNQILYYLRPNGNISKVIIEQEILKEKSDLVPCVQYLVEVDGFLVNCLYIKHKKAILWKIHYSSTHAAYFFKDLIT